MHIYENTFLDFFISYYLLSVCVYIYMVTMIPTSGFQGMLQKESYNHIIIVYVPRDGEKFRWHLIQD